MMILGFERSRQIGKHKWVVTLIVPPARAPWDAQWRTGGWRSPSRPV